MVATLGPYIGQMMFFLIFSWRCDLRQLQQLLAKDLQSPMAVAVGASQFLLNVLNKYDPCGCWELRRQEYAADERCGETGSLVITLQYSPGGSAAQT